MLSWPNSNKGGERKVLLATDGSEPALMATKKAVELALGMDATLHTICIREEVPITSLERMGEQVAEERFTGMHAMGNEVAAEYGRGRGLKVVTESIPSGRVVGAILAYAREIEPDFIVIGNSGRSGWERISLGSVAEGIMRRSEFPVVMTKGYDESYIAYILAVAKRIVLPPVEEEIELVPISELHLGRQIGLSIATLAAFILPYFGMGLMTSFMPELAVQPVFGSANVTLVWALILFPLGWASAIVFHLLVGRRERRRRAEA